MKHLLLILLLAACCAAGATGIEPARAKLLHVGWDMTNDVELRDHHREMEAAMPFDGVIMALCDSNGWGASLYPWGPGRWPEDVFDRAVDNLRSCRFEKFTDNFVLTWVSPGPVAWDDEAAWDDIAFKFGVLARAVKAAGLKGICFDPEPYEQFQWSFDPAAGLSFDDAKALARRRGYEIMEAVKAEYPDMDFLTFYMFSLPAARSDDGNLASDFWGLYPYFLNGLWEAAPEEMRLHDLSETGYVHRDGVGALSCYSTIKRGMSPLLEPALRDKYLRQINAGFGFFLDYYGKGWIRYDDSATRAVRRDLEVLLAAADRYVWCYGEMGRWFERSDTANGWEKLLPGVTRAVRLARDPSEVLAEFEAGRKAGEWPDRSGNPGFADASRPFKGFDVTDPGAVDRVRIEPGGGRNGGNALVYAGGSVTTAHGVPVAPGESIYFEAWSKCRDAGTGISIRWHGESIWTGIESFGTHDETPDAEGWRRISGILRVPDGARTAVFFLSHRGRGEAAESRIADFGVWRLDDVMD